MKRLLIIGAGGFGREVLDIAREQPQCGVEWVPSGFLDSRAELAEGGHLPLPILMSPHDYQPNAGDLLICAVDKPTDKRYYIRMMLERGANFISLIHPDVDVSSSSSIGLGCIIYKYARLGPGACLGDFSTLGYCSGLGHDAVVGTFSQLSSHVSINGRCIIGDEVLVGASVTVHPDVRVGSSSVLGIGSVVIRNVAAGKTVFGVPAKGL